MDPGLTLEKAQRLIRQWEVVHKQQDTLKDPKKDSSLTSEHSLDYVKNSVKARGSHKGKGYKQAEIQLIRANVPDAGEGSMHKKNAQLEKQNIKCKKIGHFSSLYNSRQVSAVTDQCEQKQSASEGPFLGVVTSGSLPQWKETTEINNEQAQFKLDTGAEVTIISEASHKRIGKPYLDKVSKSLHGPAGTSLEVCGQDFL